MSTNERTTNQVPAFDAILGIALPFAGFGDVLQNTSEIEAKFRLTALEAQKRLHRGFGTRFQNVPETLQELDRILADMWNTGWKPESGNLNLFVTDFGLVLAVSILDLLGGVPTFRSETDLSHFSIVWPSIKLEVFPFHKSLNCLNCREGQSISGFVTGLTEIVCKHNRE